MQKIRLSNVPKNFKKDCKTLMNIPNLIFKKKTTFEKFNTNDIQNKSHKDPDLTQTIIDPSVIFANCQKST